MLTVRAVSAKIARELKNAFTLKIITKKYSLGNQPGKREIQIKLKSENALISTRNTLMEVLRKQTLMCYTKGRVEFVQYARIPLEKDTISVLTIVTIQMK